VPTSSASTEIDADRRWLPVGLAAVATAAVVMLGLVVRARLGGGPWNMLDLGVYRWGGEQARTGGDLYGGFFPASQVVLGYDSVNLPFTYTTVAALAFIPLSFLPFTLAQPLMLLLDGAATAAIVVLSLRALGYAPGPGRRGMVMALTVGAFLLEPLAQTVGLGQINLVLVALCLADLCLPDGHRAKGIGIGLATAVKLTPAIFIVFLLLAGPRRAAIRAMAAAGGATLVAFVLLPGPSWAFWIGGLFRDARRVGRLTYVGNQSLLGVLTRLLGPGVLTTVLWMVAAAVVVVTAFVAALAWHRRGERLVAVVLVALAGLLVSPVAWSHHWVWVVPGCVIGVDAVRRAVPRAGWMLAGALAAFAAPGIMWQLPQDNDIERQWNGFQAVAGNLYVGIGLAAVAVAFDRRPRVVRSGHAGRGDRTVSAAPPARRLRSPGR
jgi:alpha-1,2-mannosyltransferase